MDHAFRRVVIGGAVALLMMAAGYLYTVRGEAILVDLAAMGSALLCL